MTDPQQPDGFRPPVPTPAPGVPPVIPPAPLGGYAAPGQQAPVGAYQVPAGGYASASGMYQPPAEPVAPTRGTGVLALLLALVASIVTPIVGGIASWEIGRRIPSGLSEFRSSEIETLAFLSPARDQVLWAELSFWVGTVLGIAAFILGVIAIVKRRGRGQGIAALIISVVGPVIFFTAAFLAFSIGAAIGAAGAYTT